MLSSSGRAALSCVALGLVVLVAVACLPARHANADSNAPAGEVLEPLPDSWKAYPYRLEVRFTDPDGVSSGSLSLALDGVPLQASADTDSTWRDVVVSAYIGRVDDGPHTAEARASDILGNGPTVLRWTFSVDTTHPVVTITYPAGNPLLENASLVLRWTGSDTGSGIDRYAVRLDDGPSFSVGNATSLPFYALGPGIHYFRVAATDVAGNSNGYDAPVAVATVPTPPPEPPAVTNATVNATVDANVRVTLGAAEEIPAWGLGVIAITAAEAVAVAALALRAWAGPGRRAWRTRVRRT